MSNCRLFQIVLLCLLVGPAMAEDARESVLGPAWARYRLTLEPGWQTDAVGPFYGAVDTDTIEQKSFRPLFTYRIDRAADATEWEFITPIVSYNRFGQASRFQFFQLIAFSKDDLEDRDDTRRLTLFPLYFHQRSANPTNDYTAVLPFYGRIKGRLLRDEVFLCMWPFYIQSRKKDVVTDNYLYPLFHRRRGDRLQGWQFWPLVGHETKTSGTVTNHWGDELLDPGHEKFFALWPFFQDNHLGIDSANPAHEQYLLPFYAFLRSPDRDRTTVIWPFFNVIDDRGKKYREYSLPWPFLMFARGEGKYMNRFWPIYGHARNDIFERNFFLWPLYRYKRQHDPPLDEKVTDILFYLYQNKETWDTENGTVARRRNLWPFFTWSQSRDESWRLQVIAPFEPFRPGNPVIERNWSPLWTLWSTEFHAGTQTRTHSFLWNFFWRKSTPESKKVSLLFGLIQYESHPEGRRWKWFFLPRDQQPPAGDAPEGP